MSITPLKMPSQGACVVFGKPDFLSQSTIDVSKHFERYPP